MDTSLILLILGIIFTALGIVFFVLFHRTLEMVHITLTFISGILAIILFVSGGAILSEPNEASSTCKFSGCTSRATTIDGFCSHHQKHLREVNELHDILESSR